MLMNVWVDCEMQYFYIIYSKMCKEQTMTEAGIP